MVTEQRIEKMNLGKYLLGVTGSTGCGKTYACKKLCQKAAQKGININYIDMDTIRRNILGTNSSYAGLRKKLSEKIGTSTNHDGSIDRKELGNAIFHDPRAMNFFREITYPAIKDCLKKETENKKGLVLVEWALLVEDGLLPTVNNNALLVKSSYETQIKRLRKGDLPLEQVIRRIGFQLTNEEKENKIREIQKKTQKGEIYVLDTSKNPKGGEYECLLEKVVMSIE